MGQRRMFFRKQKTRLPWKKDWEKQSTHKCVHTLYPHSHHTACGEEEEKAGGWQDVRKKDSSPMHCIATPTIPSAATVARSEGQNWCTADSVCVLLLLHIPSKPGLDSACWIQTSPQPPSQGNFSLYHTGLHNHT